MDLHGAVALVTGGATRVGKAIALSLAERGAAVAIHYRSSEVEAAATAEQALELGGEACCVKADLTDPDQVDSLVPAVIERLGTLSVLINNASVYQRRGLAETRRVDWEENMMVHAWAPLRLSQIMIEKLDGAPGKIINLNDAQQIRPRRFAYGISKATLTAVTRSLAAAAPASVQVNEIALGPILPPDDLARDRIDAIGRNNPAGRWGAPADVVRAVHFLIDSDYVNAETIRVDGGATGTRH